MPLSRAIDDTHSAASDFFQNLIIPEKPIALLTVNVSQQVFQRRFDRRMLPIAINPRGKETLQTKTAPYSRCGPTFCADAGFILKIQRNRAAGRTHGGTVSIDRGSSVANANSQITGKLF